MSVADIDATWAQALDTGATSLQPPMEVPGGDRIAVLADPAGAVVGLMQPTPEGSMIVDTTGAVAWIETDSRDRATSRRFYEQLFDWTARDDADADYTVFGHGGTDVAGLKDMPAGVPDEVPSYWLVYFAVDDVDAAVVRTRELGGTAATETMTAGGMRFAVLEDPLGAVFAVLEQTA
ncbi:MAG: VOC family protein [Acidimicrobiales bacterium]